MRVQIMNGHIKYLHVMKLVPLDYLVGCFGNIVQGPETSDSSSLQILGVRRCFDCDE